MYGEPLRTNESPGKRLEFEAVLQIRDHTYLLYEMMEQLGYHSDILEDLREAARKAALKIEPEQ